MSSVLMCLSVFIIIRMIKLKKSGVYVGMGVREHQAAVCGGFIGPLLWRSQTNALMPSLLMQNAYAFTKIMRTIRVCGNQSLFRSQSPFSCPSCFSGVFHEDILSLSLAF